MKHPTKSHDLSSVCPVCTHLNLPPPPRTAARERLMNTRARIGALLFGLAFLLGAAEAQAAAVCSNTPGVNDRVVCQQGDATVIDIDLTNPAIATAVANEYAVYAHHTGTGGIDVEVAGGALSATGQGGYGVFAYQRGAGGVSIVLKEGVDVTSANHGIVGLIENSANAAAITVSVTAGTVSATDATAGGAGVWAQHQGTGGIDIDLANVAVSTKGSGHGVYGRHTGAGGTGVDVDVKSGSISTVGDGAFGIGGAIIGNSGGAVSIDVTDVDVTTEGSNSHGVYGLISNAVGEALTVSVTRGSLSTAGRGAQGIFGHVAGSASTASLSIYSTAVTISTTARANGVYARQEGAGGIAFDLRGGSVTTANDSAHAVLADNRGAGGTDIDLEGVAISTTGDGSYGVFGYTGTGGGAIAIDVTGGRIVTTGDDSYGVIAADLNAASEAALSIYADGVTVTTTGYASYGIYARHAGTGSLDVDLDDAAISTAGDETYGVVGNIGNAASTAAIAIDAAGDSAIAVEGLNTAGMLGLQAGLGSVGITTGAGTAIEAPFAIGMDARATNDASAAGRIVVTPGGKVEAREAGVLAWAERSSGHTFGDGAQTADDAARTAPMIHVASSGTVTVGASVTEAFIRGRIAGADETLSAVEQAVLSAITSGDSDALDTALAALPAAYDADWKAEARNLQRKRIAESPGDAARAATANRAGEIAASEILGLSRAGIRAVVRSHTGMATFIRQGDRDPAILAIAAAARTERQQAALAEQEKLSAAERTVLEAVLTGSGLEAALDALSGATYTDDWKDGVRQRAASYNAGDIQVDVTGGSISAEGNGVEALYAVPHDRNGAIAVTVAEGARVTGGANGLYVRGAGAGEGNLHAQSVTVNGAVTGGTGAGVHLAGGGRLTVGATGETGATSGVGVLADGGDLTATVSGTVRGDVRVDGGALTLSVPEGGVVTGTVRDPAGPLTVAGSIGRLLYTDGATVTVAATGALTGVDVDGRTEALRSEAGNLDVTVAGRVAGDLRAPSGGTLTLSVPEGGVVTGTAYDPIGPLTVAGRIGRLLYSGGATVTVTATGRLTGVEGAAEALRSEAGDLDVTVAGMVTGDVLGLGDGDHMVTVARGGSVTGTVRLAASTVRVAGVVGRVHLDRGGTVTVDASGRVTGVEGVGIRSETGDLTVTVAGVVMGDILALGSGEHAVSVAPGGAVTGTVRVATESTVRVAGTAGRVLLDRGGTVAIGEAGRVTGVDGEAIRSASGELVVSIRQAPGETAEQLLNRIQGTMRDADGAPPEVRYVFADGRRIDDLGAPGSARSVPLGPFDVGIGHDGRLVREYAPRVRVYEALPSVLLGLNGTSGFHDRMAAPRSPNGVWARIETSGGSRETERSTSTSGGRLAWTQRRYRVETGVDFPLEAGVASLSAHHRRASAEVSGNDGGIDVAGNGVGASVSWRLSDGVYVDGGVSATWYDVALESGQRGSLKRDVGAFGHAVGVEAGRRVALGSGPLGALTATPRARLSYSRVGMDAFTDAVEARVSLDKGRAATGRAGVRVEASEGGSRLFGSVDVERAFSRETAVKVSDVGLSSKAEATRVLVEAGGAVEWDGGRYALQGAARWATGARDYGGGVTIKVRF